MSNVFVFRRPPHGVITEYFGGGKGGSTTTTNNVTQIPPEVLARYNAVNARAETVAQQPYQAYSQDPNAFVAPLSQTQQAGIQNTNAMAGAAQPYYGTATGLAAQSTGSVDPSALNVGQYMNPYTQSVVNATQAAMNQQQGQQLSQQQAEAIKGGAFGGDRAGLQRAQLQGQQSLAQAQAISPLYQQNYNQALAAAQQQQGVGLGAAQANRQNLQNAAQLFGSIGTNAQQAGLAGAQAQMQAGQQQQQTQQAGLQALYNQFQQQQGFPYQQAQFLANIATGTGALSGNASSGTSTTTGGGGFFSDERLKENIQRVGETDDGQPIYRYNYKGDKNTQIGLLAQDVEKKHPEAVGLAGGYKTVNYKKATEDAVHKEDGGALSGTDAYRIGAPSAMLRENSGKGLGAMPSLPQAFQGGRDIPIEAGASGAGLAALRAPQATGYSLGTREGKQAELASLQSSLAQPPGPNSDLLGSGPQYLQSRISTLQDWLNKNASPGPQYSSAGGLVGPEGGAFAHGGSFARGGLAEGDYMNPALAYYSPQQAQQGVFQLQPMPQRQILQGTPMQAPQQRQQADPFGDATKIAGLVGGGKKAYDWIKEKTKDSPAYDNEWTPGEDNAEDTLIDLNTPVAARGGLIGDRHHYSRGGINPYGGNSVLGPILEEQEQQPQPQMMKGPEAPGQKPQQQSGGLGELVGTGLKARSLYKGGEWAAGKLGLGGDTAMSATSAEALPGVAGGVVPEAVTAAVPEALTAAVPEALTAAAPEVLTAAIPEAAASIAEFLPFLLLKNGGAVPHRKNYQDRGFVVPDEYSTAEPGLAGAEGGNEVAATGGDDQTTTIGRSAPIARTVKAVPTPENAVVATTPRAREPGLNPPKSFLPEITSEGVRDTLSSENFWVPALAGLGAMLASPNKTLAGAIGSGLVGGTGAYTEMQKQNADQLMKRLQFNKERFKGPVLIDGQERYQDTAHGDWVDEPTMQGRLAAFSGQKKLGPAPGAPAPADAAVATAREELGAPKPKLETTVKPPATTPPAAIQEAGAPAATAEAPKPPATAQAATATAQPAGEKPADDIMAPPPSKLQLMNQARQNAALFADVPENRRPDYLEKEARRLQTEANDYQRQADKFAADAAKLAKNPAVQTQYTNEATRLTSLATARRTEADQKNQAANAALESAIGPALAASNKLAEAQVELRTAEPKAKEALKAKVAELHETLKHENSKYSFNENYKRQQALKAEAAAEAKEGQQILSQTKTVMGIVFDKDGKQKVSGGPLGPQIAKYASTFAQAGMSPERVMDIFGTDPRAADALDKMNASMTAEISRLESEGSPVRVTQWNAFKAANPGLTILPASLKFIVENIIEPKAKSMIGSYDAVRKLDPGKDDVENTLFEYRRDTPWYNLRKAPEEGAAQPAAPAVRQLTPEEQQRRDAEVLKRRAAQGAR